jgi:homoserine kinase type II
MEHLAARGVTCPLPVHDRNGNVLNKLAGRHAAFVTFLEGVWPRRPTAQHALEVGRAMARMHTASEGFALKRENALGLIGWRKLFDKFSQRAGEILPGMEKLIAQELDVLEKYWPETLPSGVIHADLFPDNVFFISGHLSGLIDFYFACNDALAYDLAIALNAWCFEQDFSYNVTKGRALIKGYEEVRPLDPAEKAAFPLLARGAAIRFLLTRGYDWLNTPKTALVARKDPFDYVRRLRFHQGAKSLADYGYETAP